MRAVVCHEFGPPETLVVEERPDPVAGDGQVLVDVEACGVNYVDALIAAGKYQIEPQLPFTPGTEVAGTVEAVGDEVTGIAVGDRVLASVGFNGFLSKVAVSPNAVTAIPDVLSAPAAACFTQSYCTALFALRERAHLAAGEILLVLGAAGGVGTAAIQVGKALGATVIAAASSDERLERCGAAGADHVINYTEQNLKDAARAVAGEIRPGATGVDVVFDPVGHELTELALRAMGEFGRLCIIGFARGDIPSVPVNQILLRNRAVVGVDWGIWGMTNPKEQAALLADALTMVGDGRLSPPEPTTYALDDVASALNDLLERRLVGKAALLP